MKTPRSTEEIQRILSPVDPAWKAFWFHDGTVVHSLPELATVLPKLDSKVFQHHVNGQKNDLVPWLEQVVGDQGLATHLRRVKRHHTATLAVSRRVETLNALVKLG